MTAWSDCMRQIYLILIILYFNNFGTQGSKRETLTISSIMTKYFGTFHLFH
jgi:hypothetical protein